MSRYALQRSWRLETSAPQRRRAQSGLPAPHAAVPVAPAWGRPASRPYARIIAAAAADASPAAGSIDESIFEPVEVQPAAAPAPAPRGPDDPPDLPALIRLLDEHFAAASAADMDGDPVAELKAEEAATRLIERGRELGLVRGFGTARQLPKRLYTIDELKLNKVEPEMLLSPKDASLIGVRNQARIAAAAGLAAAAWNGHWDTSSILLALAGGIGVLVADQVANGGGGEALLVDSLGRVLVRNYGPRVAYHEAGHLLVAYLLGLLPRAYTLSSLDAFLRYRALNVQAGTRFCDAGFQAEVRSGKLKASSLERFSCVALAGVLTEYLRFGRAEGGLGDVLQLDTMFRALQFSQKKADGEVRWAVLNCAALLRRHAALHDQLAAAMVAGASVGQCVLLLEERLAGVEDI
ncbi:hypothetical protein HYH03_005398 [Edaphochlamys debaryana]|uniref:Uncharacterized protein n=1 Tax=Edaphochlamys debaryana TaxID=47281 RepID=A0A835Y5V4_9CHLO|nr:hypothetical protein HYH03_005398 [Edaphochlamys debaryana]|eukprot:KAG2496576.1 hypothetical protein HYH03_005398 [Edaphochlamys debaryana]